MPTQIKKYTIKDNKLFSDTSRSSRPGEVDGKEYNFVSRELMEEQIARGEFLEFGEYKGNLYGTSLESVKSIIRSGLTCIINPHYQVEY